MMSKLPYLLLICSVAFAANRKQKPPVLSPLDQYVLEAQGHEQNATEASPGSLWSSRSRFVDLGADLRASRIDDIVTILIQERADATASGTTKASRQSKAKASVT